MPARATNNVLPSGETANASGWAPTGASLNGDTDSVAGGRGASVDTSTTEMVSSLVLATNRVVPFRATADGWWPTPTAVSSCAWATSDTSTTETVPPVRPPRPASSAQLLA